MGTVGGGDTYEHQRQTVIGLIFMCEFNEKGK